MPEFDQPFFDITTSQPGVAPLMRSSVNRTPLCTKNGGMALPITFTAPIQVTIMLLGEAIAGGVLPFIYTILGGLCSGEKPDSSILYTKFGEYSQVIFVKSWSKSWSKYVSTASFVTFAHVILSF